MILKIGLIVTRYWSTSEEDGSDGLEKIDYVTWVSFSVNIARICNSQERGEN